MSLINVIKQILSSLFGKKETSTTATSQSNPNNVEGTNMRKSVFFVMTAGEKDDVMIDYIKTQMQKKDAIGEYPYTIATDMWIYTITKPDEPYFSMYGTQYSAAQKHK